MTPAPPGWWAVFGTEETPDEDAKELRVIGWDDDGAAMVCSTRGTATPVAYISPLIFRRVEYRAPVVAAVPGDGYVLRDLPANVPSGTFTEDEPVVAWLVHADGRILPTFSDGCEVLTRNPEKSEYEIWTSDPS